MCNADPERHIHDVGYRRLGSCRTRKGKGQADKSGLIPQMLQDTPICTIFSTFLVIVHQAAAFSGLSCLFIHHFQGSAALGITPISSSFHSAGDSSPHSTAYAQNLCLQYLPLCF